MRTLTVRCPACGEIGIDVDVGYSRGALVPYGERWVPLPDEYEAIADAPCALCGHVLTDAERETAEEAAAAFAADDTGDEEPEYDPTD